MPSLSSSSAAAPAAGVPSTSSSSALDFVVSVVIFAVRVVVLELAPPRAEQQGTGPILPDVEGDNRCVFLAGAASVWRDVVTAVLGQLLLAPDLDTLPEARVVLGRTYRDACAVVLQDVDQVDRSTSAAVESVWPALLEAEQQSESSIARMMLGGRVSCSSGDVIAREPPTELDEVTETAVSVLNLYATAYELERHEPTSQQLTRSSFTGGGAYALLSELEDRHQWFAKARADDLDRARAKQEAMRKAWEDPLELAIALTEGGQGEYDQVVAEAERNVEAHEDVRRVVATIRTRLTSLWPK